MQGDDLPIDFGENKKIAARQLPVARGSVLYGRRVIGGHHGLQRRKIRDHGGGVGKLTLALMLHGLESADGIFGAIANLALCFDADGVTNEK